MIDPPTLPPVTALANNPAVLRPDVDGASSAVSLITFLGFGGQIIIRKEDDVGGTVFWASFFNIGLSEANAAQLVLEIQNSEISDRISASAVGAVVTLTALAGNYVVESIGFTFDPNTPPPSVSNTLLMAPASIGPLTPPDTEVESPILVGGVVMTIGGDPVVIGAPTRLVLIPQLNAPVGVSAITPPRLNAPVGVAAITPPLIN